LQTGWNDGDGTISYSTNRHGRKAWCSKITGTEYVCKELKAVCKEILGIGSSASVSRKTATHTIWQFSVGGHAFLKVYLEWVYRDATIYLKRKKDKADEFLRTYVGVK
jgi:hypothetical protein